MNVLPRHYCIGVTKMQKGRGGGGGGGGLIPLTFRYKAVYDYPLHLTLQYLFSLCVYFWLGGEGFSEM